MHRECDEYESTPAGVRRVSQSAREATGSPGSAVGQQAAHRRFVFLVPSPVSLFLTDSAEEQPAPAQAGT